MLVMVRMTFAFLGACGTGLPTGGDQLIDEPLVAPRTGKYRSCGGADLGASKVQCNAVPQLFETSLLEAGRRTGRAHLGAL